MEESFSRKSHRYRHATEPSAETRAGRAVEREDFSSLKAKRKKRLITALIIAGSVLLALVVAIALYAAVFMNRLAEGISMSDKLQAELAEVLVPEAANDAFYILMIGSDSRDPYSPGAGRSDTMMLARVDPDVPQVTIVSIPRDVEIYLEGYGSQKINASFAYGGPALAVKAVSELCNVPISYYVEIDFPGLISLVDTIGGIDVYVPEHINLDGVDIAAGQQHLNGAEALIMSRCRSYPTGDLVRVENQRTIIKAIVGKVLSMSVVEMPGKVTEMANFVQTTMEVSKVIDLVTKFRGMDPESMYMATVPVDFNSHDGVSYLRVVEPDFSNMMARIDQGLPPIDPLNPPFDPQNPQYDTEW